MDYNVYNHLLSSYAPKPMSKYDAHKPSELRSVMKRITKITQSSPIYLVKLSEAKQSYALNIKEAAMSLNNTLLMMADDSQDNVFVQKKAFSSDEGQIGVRITTDEYDKLPPAPEIRVNSLAETQVNMGDEYYMPGKGLSEGTYRFRISVNSDNYDFQYNIRKDANHREVLEGLSQFINKARIGLSAQTVSRSSDKIMMRIESDMTGTTLGDRVFSMRDTPDGTGSSDRRGLVSYYNLDHTISYPKNASFEMNGETRHTRSNVFSIGKALEIEMYRPGEQVAQVTYRPDSDKILDSVGNIVSTYNNMIDSSLEYSRISERTPRLMREFKHLLKPFASQMESCGITFDAQGRMQMDESLAVQAAMGGDMERLFGKDSALSQRLQGKDDEIRIDPMEYVDKTLVSYPDYSKPPKGFSYITSLYSGMLFNYYF